jgi:anti-sigma factor ChrR (cupin superfamily)
MCPQSNLGSKSSRAVHGLPSNIPVTPFDTLIHLTALEAVEALTDGEREELTQLRKTATPEELGLAENELPLLIAAVCPPQTPPAALKQRIMAAISAPPKSTLAPSRDVGFFAYARDQSAWRDHPIPGVRVRELSVNRESNYAMTLYELAPGVTFPEHPHARDEECFVLSGDLHVDGRILHSGDFHHANKGTEHGIAVTESGCTLLIVAAAEA